MFVEKQKNRKLQYFNKFRARIRIESIIREDFVVEAYELLEMFCEMLLARFGVIQQMK